MLESSESPDSSVDADKHMSPQYDSQYYDDNTVIECPPHTTEKKLVRKIDLHVIPFLCIMYLLAFLDR
jgi:hypothetical protein